MSRITLVTVSYNSAAALTDLLASVPSDLPCIIVENGDADSAPITELARAHGAKLVIAEGNIGFGRGCNLGAKGVESEFLFFVNPDASLTPDTLAALLRDADAHPEASAFNPMLLEASGKRAFKRRSTMLPRSEWIARDGATANREVPVLSGAALMVRTAAFRQVGGFDPQIFLYHEDDDLSLRLKQDCGPLRLVVEAEVQHLFGHSSARSPRVAALKAWYMGQSRVYCARKHNVAHGAMKAVKDAALQLLSPLTLLSKRKRDKHWNYLRGVLVGLGQNSANTPPHHL